MLNLWPRREYIRLHKSLPNSLFCASCAFSCPFRGGVYGHPPLRDRPDRSEALGRSRRSLKSGPSGAIQFARLGIAAPVNCAILSHFQGRTAPSGSFFEFKKPPRPGRPPFWNSKKRPDRVVLDFRIPKTAPTASSPILEFKKASRPGRLHFLNSKNGPDGTLTPLESDKIASKQLKRLSSSPGEDLERVGTVLEVDFEDPTGGVAKFDHPRRAEHPGLGRGSQGSREAREGREG